MALTILPPSALTPAAALRSRSRLQPEQVDPTLTEAAFTADVARRRDVQANVVETAILGVVTVAEWAALDSDTQARLQAVAVEATDALTLASLYESSGFLGDAYDEEADRLRAKADRLLSTLTAGVQTATDGEPAKGGTVQMERSDGYSSRCPEYSRC